MIAELVKKNLSRRSRGAEFFFSASLRLCGLLISLNLFAQSQEISLNQNWEFRKAGDTIWYPATVPGCVHTDLLANKLISDPFYRDNESKVQWVENEDWEYQTFFDCDSDLLQYKHPELHFDGLDTYADVYFNDSLILRADNMFRSWDVDVKKKLRARNNHLFIHFYSAVKKGKELAAQLDYKLPGDEGGKAFERKAQYQFGWDWGPRLVTCGVWKTILLWGCTGNMAADIKILPDRGRFSKPQFNQQSDSLGSSFCFQLNGQPLFIKGANIIPPDNFLPRVTPADYKRLVDDAVACHMNMLRVWGGGAYLPDEFYDYCDEKGILIWQDFMFAGAMVPGDSAFAENVKQEAIDQVIRLRNHPCIALWCGNNEINEAWNNWGFQDENKSQQGVNEKIWNDYKRIFDTILPQVVHKYDPGIFYWESSPSIGWGHKEAFQQGDSHYWGVWWGEEPFSAYENHVGRFMSEYGFQAMPSMDCFYEFATPDDWKQIPIDKKSASPVLNVHEKHSRGYEILNEYMQRDYKVPTDFEKYAYVSQLVQRDGIGTAIEAHRRAKPYCMGTLYWQLNDCWPVTSWSSEDYYGKWKALQYALQNDLYKTFLISMKEENDSVSVYVVSDSLKDVNARLKIELVSFNGKEIVPVWDSVVHLSANSSMLLLKISFTQLRTVSSLRTNSSTYLLHAELSFDEEMLATKNFFFTKPKDLSLPNPNLKTEILYSRIKTQYEDYPNVYLITLHTDAFAKDVFLSYDFEDVKFSDNFFDMLPGETKTVIMYAKQAIDQVNLPVKVISLRDSY